MSGLIKLKEEFHNLTLKHRSIYALITQSKFEALWILSSESEQQEIINEVKALNRQAVTNRIKALRDPGEISFDDLRKRAKKLQINNYSRLDRVQLINAIRREIDRG
jgi:tRNA(Ser,Leu) C12 N-acetylase TAN1